MDEKYIVYVRADEAGRIVEINSSAFLADTAVTAISTTTRKGTISRYHCTGRMAARTTSWQTVRPPYAQRRRKRQRSLSGPRRSRHSLTVWRRRLRTRP